jgi:hypothetical protein
MSIATTVMANLATGYLLDTTDSVSANQLRISLYTKRTGNYTVSWEFMTDRELLERSLAELQAQVDRHRLIVRDALSGHAVDPGNCPWSDCRHRSALLDVALKAVTVLDDTRKAFKSRQLEILRRDFIRVLEQELRAAPAFDTDLRK